MLIAREHLVAVSCGAALCLLLAACSGSGGGNGGAFGNSNGGNSGANSGGATPPPPPFPTVSTDDLPAGPRIDVSTKNLFQMASGDVWSFNIIDGNGNPAGTTQRKVVSDDGAGHVQLEDDDGGASITPYTVTADGLLNTQPLDVAPASATAITGAIFDYATPLYPVGAVRRHVRSGPWGADVDGDGIGESFRFEYTQVFLGFETMQLSPSITLDGVAHFRNVVNFTLRPTAAGNADANLTSTEEAWFAPGLGMIRAQRVIVDGNGSYLDLPHTLAFSGGTVGGTVWDLSEPPPVLGGTVLDVFLVHNALVYDSVRNVYYASVPGSVANNGNRIATIDPATGQVSFSQNVGTEPDALAIAADASVLYVGLDGTNELLKLALPAMTELGRASLGSPLIAGSIAVSPVDPDAVVVARMDRTVIPSAAGVVLFRGLVMQPRTPIWDINLVAFDPTGTVLYGLDNEDTGQTVSRMQVLADGLLQDLAQGNSGLVLGTMRSLSFANDRIIAGHTIYNAPALTAAGVAPGPADCQPQRSANRLLCFRIPDGGSGEPRLLIVDGDTLVIKALPLYAGSEPAGPRRLVEGPAGQVAVSYPANASGFVSKIHLFSGADLIAPSAPPPSWAVATSSTFDGTALSLGIPHGALVYDVGRNAYYASIPGSAPVVGNSIATIDPSNGQISYSAPVGSEPNALAIAADGSALYVGLDGSGEVVKLALPSMTEQGRIRLPVDSFLGHTSALALAVSPADSSVAAVSTTFLATGSDVVLLLNMVTQPAATGSAGPNQLVFDTAGTTLYGLNSDNGILDQWQVGSNGLTLQNEIRQFFLFKMDALSFANNQIIMGPNVFDAPALTLAGTIPNTYNCWAARAGTSLFCLGPGGISETLLVVDAPTSTAAHTLLYGLPARNPPSTVVQGPSGQVAVDYSGPLGSSSIVLVSSSHIP